MNSRLPGVSCAMRCDANEAFGDSLFQSDPSIIPVLFGWVWRWLWLRFMRSRESHWTGGVGRDETYGLQCLAAVAQRMAMAGW